MEKVTTSALETLASFLPQISEFLRDESVSELMVNGNGTVYVEDRSGMRAVTANITPHAMKEAAVHIARLNGQNIGAAQPIVDTRLEDGSRVALIYPPCSVGGVALSVRKFQRQLFTLESLVEIGTITEKHAAWLTEQVRDRQNILISGGTSTGKTTLANALANCIPADQRLVIIEDTAEIQVNLPNINRFETQKERRGAEGRIISSEVKHGDLVKAVLRLRPDRIILGEIRGPEAYDLLQALNTGHAGSISTIHANGPVVALNRLAALALSALPELSYEIVERDIQTAIQTVVQIAREHGSRRRVTAIARIEDYDAGKRKFILDSIEG